jgi:hypothetical protein
MKSWACPATTFANGHGLLRVEPRGKKKRPSSIIMLFVTKHNMSQRRSKCSLTQKVEIWGVCVLVFVICELQSQGEAIPVGCHPNLDATGETVWRRYTKCDCRMGEALNGMVI